METDSTVCKITCLLALVLLCAACGPICDPEMSDAEYEVCVERHDPNRDTEPETELDSFGCPVDRGPAPQPYPTEPLVCEDWYVTELEYSEQDEDYAPYEKFWGTCCEWAVMGRDGYERYCLWVFGSCEWEYVGGCDYKESLKD